jgi:hypothetical protein
MQVPAVGISSGASLILERRDSFYAGSTDVHTIGRNGSSSNSARLPLFLLKNKGVDVLLPASSGLRSARRNEDDARQIAEVAESKRALSLLVAGTNSRSRGRASSPICFEEANIRRDVNLIPPSTCFVRVTSKARSKSFATRTSINELRARAPCPPSPSL